MARGDFLNKLGKLSLEIEDLRQVIYDLMEEEEYVISPEIIMISQRMDELITEYNRAKKPTHNK